MRRFLGAISGFSTSLAIVILSIFAFVDTAALSDLNRSVKVLKAEIETLKADIALLKSDPGDLPAAGLLPQ